MQQSLILGAALAALIAGPLASQASNTLPKGWDTTEGILVGSTTASQFWAGFDLGSTSTATYNPAKAMYLYDASDFPWDPKKSKLITKLSFRRDGASNTATAHTREWLVIMSTSNVTPARANFNYYDGNHGTNRTEVFGTLGKPGTVKFLATKAPTAPATAPFDVVVTLTKPFLVPANSKTLVIEIRSYKVSGATSGWWRADSVTYPGTNYLGSSFSLINTDHCVSPSIFYLARTNNIGSNFVHVYRTYQSPGGDPFVAVAGLKTTTPFLFPGTKCNVHVNPIIHAVFGTTEKSGQFAMVMDYGRIPNKTGLVGVSVDCQGLVANKNYPGGAGLTRAWTTKIGRGYDPKVTPGTQIYSYGANTTMYHGTSSSNLMVNPDAEKYGRYFYRRHVIVKIN